MSVVQAWILYKQVNNSLISVKDFKISIAATLIHEAS